MDPQCYGWARQLLNNSPLSFNLVTGVKTKAMCDLKLNDRPESYKRLLCESLPLVLQHHPLEGLVHLDLQVHQGHLVCLGYLWLPTKQQGQTQELSIILCCEYMYDDKKWKPKEMHWWKPSFNGLAPIRKYLKKQLNQFEKAI